MNRLIPPDRAGLRVFNLLVGLILFGFSLALMVSAELGVSSWDVLHQGLAERTGLAFGWVVSGVSLLVLVLWIPLRERPGVGTVANAFIVGMAAQAALWLAPQPSELSGRLTLLTSGIVVNAFATGLYIGAGLGAGPRDGLMTGLARRGWSIRRARTGIEIAVLITGWVLGGTVGVGTLAYALTIGPLVHAFLARLSVRSAEMGTSGSRIRPFGPRFTRPICSEDPC